MVSVMRGFRGGGDFSAGPCEEENEMKMVVVVVVVLEVLIWKLETRKLSGGLPAP